MTKGRSKNVVPKKKKKRGAAQFGVIHAPTIIISRQLRKRTSSHSLYRSAPRHQNQKRRGHVRRTQTTSDATRTSAFLSRRPKTKITPRRIKRHNPPLSLLTRQKEEEENKKRTNQRHTNSREKDHYVPQGTLPSVTRQKKHKNKTSSLKRYAPKYESKRRRVIGCSSGSRTQFNAHARPAGPLGPPLYAVCPRGS